MCYWWKHAVTFRIRQAAEVGRFLSRVVIRSVVANAVVCCFGLSFEVYPKLLTIEGRSDAAKAKGPGPLPLMDLDGVLFRKPSLEKP
jgi:hypothetical protein